jgi:hypothetical protein
MPPRSDILRLHPGVAGNPATLKVGNPPAKLRAHRAEEDVRPDAADGEFALEVRFCPLIQTDSLPAARATVALCHLGPDRRQYGGNLVAMNAAGRPLYGCCVIRPKGWPPEKTYTAQLHRSIGLAARIGKLDVIVFSWIHTCCLFARSQRSPGAENVNLVDPFDPYYYSSDGLQPSRIDLVGRQIVLPTHEDGKHQSECKLIHHMARAATGTIADRDVRWHPEMRRLQDMGAPVGDKYLEFRLRGGEYVG